MKFIFGLVLLVAGITLGCWAGIWWAFIGGIVDVIAAIRAPALDALAIALGIAKVFFAGLIGYSAGGLLVIPGAMLMRD